MPATANCPAAEIVHPILSPNDADVECRIAGRLQPTEGSDGSTAICCDNYADCKIWQVAKRNEDQNREARIGRAQRRRAPHTLSDEGHDRELVKAGG